jgi:drug/metabolite transporter (DMT)-like permease
MGLAALLLAPIAYIKYRTELAQLKRCQYDRLILGGFFLALHFICWITSLSLTSIASSVVIVTTAPLWVALLSPVFLKEKLGREVLIGLAISLVGGVIVSIGNGCSVIDSGIDCHALFSQNSSSALLGNLLALAGAIFSAAYIMVGRKMRGAIKLIPYTFTVYSSAAIFLLFGVIASRQHLFDVSSIYLPFLIALAIIPQIIGHSAFNWALKYLSASYVSIALLGEPVGTVILAYLFLKETPTILEIVGGVMIIGGVILASLAESKAQLSSSSV